MPLHERPDLALDPSEAPDALETLEALAGGQADARRTNHQRQRHDSLRSPTAHLRRYETRLVQGTATYRNVPHLPSCLRHLMQQKVWKGSPSGSPN